jgi:hypothetical protein
MNKKYNDNKEIEKKKGKKTTWPSWVSMPNLRFVHDIRVIPILKASWINQMSSINNPILNVEIEKNQF